MKTDFNTPFDNVMDHFSDTQCSLCRYHLKDKTWYCTEVKSWYFGSNPCMKKEELMCPVCRKAK